MDLRMNIRKKMRRLGFPKSWFYSFVYWYCTFWKLHAAAVVKYTVWCEPRFELIFAYVIRKLCEFTGSYTIWSLWPRIVAYTCDYILHAIHYRSPLSLSLYHLDMRWQWCNDYNTSTHFEHIICICIYYIHIQSCTYTVIIRHV